MLTRTFHRTPHFSFETLTTWYSSGDPNKLARVFDYYRNRVEMDIEMIVAAEVIEQNWCVNSHFQFARFSADYCCSRSEAARVYGVDFKSVRTRGSQFKVESVMFKISKPESFMLLSPSRTDVGRQNAAECQPLIMEPPSGFYKSPVVVLDFQSLYPSVMIGFNYCYSWANPSSRLSRLSLTSLDQQDLSWTHWHVQGRTQVWHHQS